MSLKYYILSFLLFCTGIAFAQDLKLTASVNRNTVGTGEAFEVTFSISGNIERFAPPDMSGFQVVGGPNQSSSMSMINGTTTSSMSLSYDLVATREGTFTIGPATVVVNGKQYRSNPISVKVVKGQAQPQQQQAQQGGGQQQDVSVGRSGDIAKNLFIRAIPDKVNVYQGEQLTVSYKLYSRVMIAGNQGDKQPEFNGFWSQDIKNMNQQVSWTVETYKGVRYQVAVLRQTILFPEHSGNLVLDPLGMTFIVRQEAPPKDVMEQFFGGGYKDVKYKVESPPVTIHVKPLPEAGKPEGFTGAVGNFSFDASVDKKELKANEALNYRLKITGSGNIKLLNTLNTNFPADFEKYDPKITDTVTEKLTGVSGSRIYNYLVIPRHEGTYTIDPVKFSYFNPATERYVTLPAKPFQIKVNKGDAAATNVSSYTSANKEDVKVLGKDIRYIKDSLDLHKENEEFYGSALYYLLLLLGPLVFIGAFAYRRWDEQNNSDVIKVKSRKASKIAAKHLANAQLQLTARNTNAFYEAISKGLYGYISDKLNIPAADLSKETIADQLKTRGVDNMLITQLTDTLELCEMARFAPVTGISEQEVFDKTKNIINDIEEKI
ncbi:BatD family protein [Mucilaginibacter sp. AW1-3]